MQPERLFEEDNISKAFDAYLQTHSISVAAIPRAESVMESHALRERVVELTMTFLQKIGYRADPFSQYRSQMHDITHAIYGAAADVFVTGDDRFLHRLRATYAFLKLRTRLFAANDLHRLLLSQ